MKEVKEQETAKRILSASLKTEKFPPCFLFCGPPGVGKLTTALDFASKILQEQLRTFKGTHPDLEIVFPEFEGYEKGEIIKTRKNKEYFKIRQKKGSISIDTIRNLQDYVYITPMENKWRIAIIAQAERITKQGFNALLKILEEPPENVIFILITPEKHILPDTIISRSRIVNFNPLSPGLQKAILKDDSIKRFGRGIEKTQFVNSKEALAKEIEKTFFNISSKSRIRNWSEKIKKDWEIEFLLQYLQKSIESKYKRREIKINRAWESLNYIKQAYRYYYSNIGPEKIIFYLLLKI
jgi:DNA polymerase III delta prime subunit